MRIGECLGLRHSDIHSEMGLNEIHVIPRDDNLNDARVKDGETRIISVPRQTMRRELNHFIPVAKSISQKTLRGYL
jgi:hypothetical protein